MKEKWKEETLKTIVIYRKGLEIATSPKIKNLTEKYKKYREKFGENNKKTLKIAKKQMTRHIKFIIINFFRHLLWLTIHQMNNLMLYKIRSRYLYDMDFFPGFIALLRL